MDITASSTIPNPQNMEKGIHVSIFQLKYSNLDTKINVTTACQIHPLLNGKGEWGGRVGWRGR